MKRITVLLSCGVVAAGAGVAGCGSSSSSSTPSASSSSSSSGSTSSGSTSSSANDPIPIAILEPTSGPLGVVAAQIAGFPSECADPPSTPTRASTVTRSSPRSSTRSSIPPPAATGLRPAGDEDHDVAVLGPLISPEANSSVPDDDWPATPRCCSPAPPTSISRARSSGTLLRGLAPTRPRTTSAMAALVKHLELHEARPAVRQRYLGLTTKTDIANDMKFTLSVQTSETATDLTPQPCSRSGPPARPASSRPRVMRSARWEA